MKKIYNKTILITQEQELYSTIEVLDRPLVMCFGGKSSLHKSFNVYSAANKNIE